MNALIRSRIFPEHQGRAWLKHNVEEVGNFQLYLPALFADQHNANVSSSL